MAVKQYAEDLPYWGTDSDLSGNQARIERLLRDWQARAVEVTMGWNEERCLWRIRFEWRGRIYRFDYEPWPCRGDGNIKGRPRAEAAIRQMGARAFNEIKALLTAAAFDMERDIPRALYGYLEDAGAKTRNAQKPRMSDYTPESLAQRLTLPALAASNDSTDFTEVG